MKNTVGLKLHGPPMGLRACCLLFICVFPFIFIPTLINDLNTSAPVLVYALAMIHGFILISLYNVQDAMEDPFDQVGLDDIKLEEFHFEKNAQLFQKSPGTYACERRRSRLSCSHRDATILAILRLPEVSLNVAFQFFLSGAKRPTFVLSDAGNGQGDLLTYFC